MYRHTQIVKFSNWEKDSTVYIDADTVLENEWTDTSRIREDAWQQRYDYESHLITHFINEARLVNILEIGSGPGELSKFIHNKVKHEIHYDLVDKPSAKIAFEELGYKGNFFVKDVSNGLDTTGLKSEYDLIICNDCLEHLFSPSLVIQKFHQLISDTGFVFISNPNWRMGHWYIYRGLFDYDNFNYMFHTHGLELKYQFPSTLQTPDYPRLDSEKTMPEELRTSWNHYLVYEKRKDLKK
jgi:2-polyprenyl-3-methyl-5-hydroxy-6-metoxy-1,4-benzoquinol methylase